jgi:hypothetical protein
MATFPTQVQLSGPDYFQVVLDAHHRTHGGVGNLSRLAITLEGQVDANAIEDRISSNSFARWLHSLRLSKRWFGKPLWRASATDVLVVGVHEKVHELDIPVRCDPRLEPALRFDLVIFNGQTVLLYSWNHILMDARGAEILLMHLGSDVSCVFAQPEQESTLSWRERLTHIRTMKDYILERVQTLPTIARNAGQKVYQFGYRNIQFSAEETHKMDLECDSHHIRLGKSAFYLAATTRAFHEVVGAPDTNCNYWVPVPQDRRRKGVLGPVFGNQVSSLYYSITHDCIGSLSEVVQMLSTSLMDQMRSRLPECTKVMLDALV